jgi:hypothetical protein|tara:strand:- start:2993 stop:3106 length:114 start_codon:yes stop_codon:yes gene_type:complete
MFNKLKTAQKPVSVIEGLPQVKPEATSGDTWLEELFN